MDNKLDLITRKLYDEGVEKAKSEADKILQEAKKEADEIIAKSKKEASEIISTADKEAENIAAKTKAELNLTGKQAVAALKQDIVNLISNKISEKVTRETFEDKDFVKKLILAVVQKWGEAEGNTEMNVLMAEDIKESTEAYFAKEQKSLMDKGLKFVKGASDKEGFVIQPKDGSYKLEFTDEVFEEFFGSFLRDFTRNLLFEK